MESVDLESGRAGESSTPSETSSRWLIWGNKLPKSEIVFFAQVILIYIIVITSIVNISLGDTQELWVILLTSCLGYLMPSPSLYKNKHGEYVRQPA